MLLDVDAAVFAADQDDQHVSVVRLLGLVAEGRHEWHPTMAVALAAEEFLAVVMPKTGALMELVRKSLEESANPQPALPTASVGAERLREAVEDLGQAAVVVVEDGVTEKLFLLAVAQAFGYRNICSAVDKTWLCLVNASGKDRMAHFVEEERRKFRVLVRVAALLDSDSERPDEPGESNRRQLDMIRAIDGMTEVHMWTWREVENYVPCAVWSHHLPNREDRIDVIRSMIPEQRGYVDIKQILVGRRRMPKPLIPEELTLTADDFDELGSDAVDELKAVLTMIARIL